MFKVLSIVLLGFFFNASSQSVEFPVDENGLYTFTEVVDLPGIKKELLLENGSAFMKEIKVLQSRKKHLEVDKAAFSITNKGSFYVYRLGSIKKAIDGAVEYDIILEIKDGKYRYTITNFIFNPYERNRYGTYEPVKGKYIALEANMTSLNQKEWEKHREVVFDKTTDLINNLYGSMIYSETKKSKKVKKEENW